MRCGECGCTYESCGSYIPGNKCPHEDCIEINSMVPENLIMIDGEPFSSESVKIYFDCKQKFNTRKEMEVSKEDLINGAFDDALDIIDRKANEVKHD